MADVSLSIMARVEKGNLSHSFSAQNITASMASVGMKSMTLSLTTASNTSIDTSGMTNPGLCFMRNLSTATSSTAQIGIVQSGSFISFSTVKAGEPAVFRMTPGTSLYAKGTSQLRVDIIEA